MRDGREILDKSFTISMSYSLFFYLSPSPSPFCESEKNIFLDIKLSCRGEIGERPIKDGVFLLGTKFNIYYQLFDCSCISSLRIFLKLVSFVLRSVFLFFKSNENCKFLRFQNKQIN